MFEELREIDTATIEELGRIKQEQEVLEDRLARMEAEKEQVSDAVYGRVKQDYAARCQALDDKARPLKEQARLEYRKLQALDERLQKAVETARLDKEELEFRHRLGEFDDDPFQERLGVCEKQLEERQGELSEVEELKQRFTDAFRSEVELREGPEEAPEEAPAAPVESAEVTPPEPPEAEEAQDEEADAAEADAAAPGEADQEPSEPPEKEMQPTTDMPGEVEPPPVPPPPPAATVAIEGGEAQGDDAQGGDSEATVFLKGPRLIIHRGESMEELALELDPVTIGRAVKNTVRFVSTSVSRHHARVSLSKKGYVVSDLGSGNGTVVNGELVTGERQLRDGDTIQVGSEVLIFRDR